MPSLLPKMQETKASFRGTTLIDILMSSLGYIHTRSCDNGGIRSSLLLVQPTAQGGVSSVTVMSRTNRHLSEKGTKKRYPYRCFGGILAQRLFFVNTFYKKTTNKYCIFTVQFNIIVLK